MTFAVIASMISSIALWGLLVGFGLWIHRKFHFRSLPWVAAFMLLTLIFALTDKWAMHFLLNKEPTNLLPMLQNLGYNGTLGNLVAELNYWRFVLSNLAYIILASLILSDIVNLLSTAGIDVKDRFGQKFALLREKSTTFGITMLALKFVPTVGFMFFFFMGFE